MNPPAAEAPVAIRRAESRDTEAILTIYNVAVVETTVTFDLVPRSHEEQIDWINDHSGSYPAVVAVDGADTVVGFGSLSAYRDRPAYTTTVEDSVYVEESVRGQKIGSLILDELIRLGVDHGFHSVIARIVGGHEASIALHRAHGFELVGTEREVGRKFNKWLDIVLMQRIL